MNENVPYELLAKYFTGESNAAEKEIVERWRKKNSKNEKIFEEFLETWNHADTTDRSFNPDITDALNQVNRKIRLAENPFTLRRKSNSFIFYSLRIAAVLIIAFAIWYFYKEVFAKEIYLTENNTGKSIKSLVLEDGTRVTLNTGSLIRYPRKFRSNIRNIELTGEAYFDVAKDPDKAFTIHAQNTITRVMGTSFNLRAFPSENEVVLTVTEGKVAFADKTLNKAKTLDLYAGDKGIVNKSRRTITKEKNDDINFMSWKDKQLIFEHTPLKIVAEDLSRFYGTMFLISNPVLDSVTVNDLEFKNSPLDSVILSFNYLGIIFTRTDSGFIIDTEPQSKNN